jgi:hypothetical protein
VFLDEDPSAGKPYRFERPYEKSIAIYTHFESSEDIDYYQFKVTDKDLGKSGLDILIGSLVPACKPLRKLLLSWEFTGPDGLIEKVENEAQGKLWYEPYTAHYYFYQQRKKFTLTQSGLYQIKVWSSSSMKGDYVLEFGDKEMWGLTEILYTLWVYPKLLLEAEIHTEGCTTSELGQSSGEVPH